MSFIVGIDASRNRSGGAKAHLIGILGATNPASFGIQEIHIWSYKSLLDQIPDFPWLIKHNPKPLEKSFIAQAWWQYSKLHVEARKAGCHIMLNTDAGTIGGFSPSVVMSRDMLSYEKGEIQRYGWSMARLRLLALKYIQARSLKSANGAIFLTKYAADVIQEFTGPLKKTSIIPHGVGSAFRQESSEGNWHHKDPTEDIKCLYVSNAAMYKHQWHVVRAIGQLRNRGYKISLLLVGGGAGKAQQLLDDEIKHTDPHGNFVSKIGFIKHDELPVQLATTDLFIFASSCENMPNTLVEAMAAGLPIACSNRGPMPEVLENGGVYFDPENPDSIASAVEKIINDKELRISIAHNAKQLGRKYSWERCAKETWNFLADVHGQVKSKPSEKMNSTLEIISRFKEGRTN
jgi:glycosyltransferase involved in cell wall biosynthesis